MKWPVAAVLQEGHAAVRFHNIAPAKRGIGMFERRQGLIVWLYSLKHVKNLRKFGNIHYVSKKMKYIVLYCEMDRMEQLMEKISSFSFVKRVEPSYKPFLKLEFESKVDKAKEYDYKMGL